MRQRRARNPLYDLHVAGRRIFWVAAVRGDHRLRLADGRDVRRPAVPAERPGYSTLEAGAAFLPAVVFMVLVAPRSAKLVEARGARFTLLTGYVFLLLGFAAMLLLWDEGSPYWQVGLAYVLIGIGVGLRRHAGVPLADGLRAGAARRDGLRHRRPAARPRRRDHAVDLRCAAHRGIRLRGFGNYCGIGGRRPGHDQRSEPAHQSFSSAAAIAERYPQYSTQIIQGAKSSFLAGADWAYTAGIIAIVVGAAIVFFLFPKREQELQLLATYHAEDTNRPAATSGQIKSAPQVED